MRTKTEIAAQFRIVTDGDVYRVERLVEVGRWWWKRDEWQPLCHTTWVTLDCPRIPFNFSTLEEAEAQIKKDIERAEAEERGWSVVKPEMMREAERDQREWTKGYEFAMFLSDGDAACDDVVNKMLDELDEIRFDACSVFKSKNAHEAWYYYENRVQKFGLDHRRGIRKGRE